MPTAPTWLEVSLNGPWTRERQPLIPIRVADIVGQGIACVQAGASIVHVHAYDERTGRQNDDADTYAAIIEGIRAKTDAIVYPTLPFSGHADPVQGARERFAHVEALCERGLMEWGVVDPGTTQITALTDVAEGKAGFIYANPEAHIRRGMELAQRHRYHPGYAIYEPAFLRLGAAMERAYPGTPQAIYRFMFSDGLSFGFPPAPFALAAYVALLRRERPQAPWMIAGLDVDVRPLVEMAVANGGHVRVGLEDAPFGSNRTNVEWVEDAVRRIRAAGGEPATPAAVREALAHARAT